jgi:hypothetical protein
MTKNSFIVLNFLFHFIVKIVASSTRQNTIFAIILHEWSEQSKCSDLKVSKLALKILPVHYGWKGVYLCVCVCVSDCLLACLSVVPSV